MNKLFATMVALLILAAGALLYRDYAASRPGSPVVGAAADTGATPGAPGRNHADTVNFWNPATGAGRRWIFSGGAAPSVQDVQQAGAEWVPVAMARRGWGGDDALVWLETASRVLHLWRLGDTGSASVVKEVPYRGTEWTIIAMADANGDGEADLVWRHVQSGIAVWVMQDGAPTEQAPVGDATGRSLVAVADLNGDKREELVWRDDTSGQVEVWTLDGVKTAEVRGLSGADAAWRPVAAVRVDDDASEDLLWQKSDTLQLSVWPGGDNARAFLLARPGVAGWSLATTADVDGDGREELVWTNDADGSAGAWRLGSDGSVTDLALPAAGLEWRVIPGHVGTAPGAATPADMAPAAEGDAR